MLFLFARCSLMKVNRAGTAVQVFDSPHFHTRNV